MTATSKLRANTLKNGQSATLYLGNKIESGTYIVKVYWEYGEEKGVMEFPIVQGVESSDQVNIPKDQVNTVLEKIGHDEARISITKVEVEDYRLSDLFPRKFSIGETEIRLDLFNNEMRIGEKSYKFESHTHVYRGKLCIDVKLNTKNMEGNILILSFYQDGKVGIKYGDSSYPVRWIRMDEKLDLIEIRYEGGTGEYSFNFKHLNEQMGKHPYEIELKQGQRGITLKEELFRLLGYDALEELESKIGKDVSEDERIVLLVHFDNGKVAYCGNKRLEVGTPRGAKSITSIEMVAFRDLTELKKLALRVREEGNPYWEGLLGEEAMKEKKIIDQIREEISRSTGIPKDEIEVEHWGEEKKEGGPDFVLRNKGTGKIVAVIEVKYVGNPESAKDFGDRISKARDQVDRYMKSKEWACDHGAIVVISWPVDQILNDEPWPSNVGDYKNPYIEYRSKGAS